MAALPSQERFAMMKQKRDFDFMTSSVLLEHQKHLLASLHFKALYNRLLFVPSIGITLASGLLAVLAQSGLYSEHTQSIFTILIAVLASVSVFWQSLTKQLDYGGRASLHDSTAMALSKIYKSALMRSRQQQDSIRSTQPRGETSLEINQGSDHVEETNQDGSSISTEVAEGNAASTDHLSLTRQFEQALQGCTSVVPIRIQSAFDALDSSVYVCNKKLVPSKSAKNPNIAWEKVYPALYHQLTLTIIGSIVWPYVVPNADRAVAKTIKHFQNMDACLIKVMVKRTLIIDEEYKSLATETTPLSSV